MDHDFQQHNYGTTAATKATAASSSMTSTPMIRVRGTKEADVDVAEMGESNDRHGPAWWNPDEEDWGIT